MEALSEAPQVTSFVPLIEHQSATPASFHTGPAVLHYHSQRCKATVPESDLSKNLAIQQLFQRGVDTSAINGHSSNGDVDGAVSTPENRISQRTIEDVDVWVTSRKLLLYSHQSSAGISIPYPSIALHAIQTVPAPTLGDQQGLYMQLLSQPDNDSQNDEDDDLDSISLTILPQNDAPPPSLSTDPNLNPNPGPDTQNPDSSPQPPTLAMFTALSNCSNLHPDPNSGDDPSRIQSSALFQAGLIAQGDGAGGLPPAMPGSSGWITAENMGEYFDEEGNWIHGDENEDGAEVAAGQGVPLGPGAGAVRPREDQASTDEPDAEDGSGENGTSEETKWRRTG